ncbi:MAG: RNA-guided pseudouridylation complex pseudouridine synthase subunit Cbf5 [Thaumarchaeota archaeon]|nr:RNA-guided pseudouridylation complex pseudouridine synthase subunit Cbf5 [Nitrososphaerota archaeon]MCL5318022.1 RNA-guided pseudouridylation complex pseudouridine synthase subunit Cbf5 [Nitrososphaerota archaeon]
MRQNTSSNLAASGEDLLTLDVEGTNDNYGTYPEKRTVEELLDYGFIALDKPAGPTSHEVVAWVRKMLKIEKAGHSGTLDPGVTGLLPIGLGEATKALSVLLIGPKEYIGVARLHSPVDDAKIKRVFKEFTGEIYQRPPQKSSVKRQTRRRWIHELDIIEEKGRLILFRTLCQSGTYIRKLIYDIGEALGPGATMVELRRTKVSQLNEKNGLVSMHDLADAIYLWREEHSEEKIRRLVRPVEEIVALLKKVIVRDSAVSAICHGAQLATPGILQISPDIAKGDTVAIYTLKGELVAIGEALMSSAEIEVAEKGIAFETRRVIMKPDTYPRLWKPKRTANAGVA